MAFSKTLLQKKNRISAKPTHEGSALPQARKGSDLFRVVTVPYTGQGYTTVCSESCKATSVHCTAILLAPDDCTHTNVVFRDWMPHQIQLS